MIIENELLRLTVGDDCVPKSLICKRSGEELLYENANIPLFSLTEERPYNNEIKLAHPNKRTVFKANSLSRRGDRLTVGFEKVGFKAEVSIIERPTYVTFRLEDFIVGPDDFPDLSMTPPPVSEFCLLQLPIKKRERFGEWLNIVWDDKTAVCVTADSPYARVDAEERDGFYIMKTDAIRGIRLKGCAASLIVSPGKEAFLDAMDSFERENSLPLGVESRRSEDINRSVYWTPTLAPNEIDKHIERALQGGFEFMLVYYTALFCEGDGYTLCGNYDFNNDYPDGYESVRAAIAKIKAAGIIPGLHVLQTHIGIKSRYVTPRADHRLRLVRHFTLAKALGRDDTTLYVEQSTEGTVMHPNCRVLQFGGEMIRYESYTVEPPYAFLGCERGCFGTDITEHEIGTIGGIPDISEYGATSIYLDQDTSLADEVAEKIAKAYNAGFEFAYFDGSEGTNPPFEIYVPMAQYRVYKRFGRSPRFCEGAAKAHFSWHMLSGGNAFDIFPTDIFKKMIAKHPLEEIERMRNDMTRINFGWWAYREDTMPDIIEYGTSKAAACDCPVAVQISLGALDTNPRTADNLEVYRRWEDVRRKKWLSDEQKALLKDSEREFTLLVNESGDYELVKCQRILPEGASESLPICAYIFERAGRAYASVWHTKGSDRVFLPISGDLTYERELGGERLPIDKTDGGIEITVSDRGYLHGCDIKELVSALERIHIV